MYIQNATYKAVPTAGLTFPLAEGTVLTVGDVTGIAPENISLAAHTGLIYLAVGGTIDLTSEANAGVTFTDEQLNELGGDFNFIPMTEAGGSSLPSYTSADIGKVLTVGEGSETVQTVIVPEQTVTVGAPIPEAILTTDYDISTLHNDDLATLTIDRTSSVLSWVSDSEGTGFFGEDYYIAVESGVWTLHDLGSFAPGASITVSLTVSTPKAEPKWENAGGAPTIVNITRTGTDTYEADMSYEEIANAYSKGVVCFNFYGTIAIVTRKNDGGVIYYRAELLLTNNMNGWKLVDLAVEVDAESVTGAMNTFDLTLSDGTPM